MRRIKLRSHFALTTALKLLGLAATLACGPSLASAEPFWRQVMPRERVAADPQGDYTLAETNGPWLIMAASFQGEHGESDARDLVRELRTSYNLPAYYYGMTFDIGESRPGRGVDQYGGKIKRRYQRGNRVVEHAVLVGDYHSIDDPEAQHTLDRIKRLEPKELKPADGEITSQSLAGVRQIQRNIKQRFGKPVVDGPMGHAFITRNPLLPKEYFVPPGVDADVAKWNKNVEHSLLDCPGKYTIKVATFRGRTTLRRSGEDVSRELGVRAATERDPLVVAVENAHKLTVALRQKGWEAYEFHDRYESCVTVGSFDQMQQLDDGRLLPATREAQIIVETFGAATPNNVFEKGVDAKTQMKEAEIRSQFKSAFANGYGQISEGFHPKRFVGLPFDIQPTPMAAPKQSISSAYVRN